MLASLVDKPFDRQGWLWEPKLDGIRVLAYLSDGKVELRSRRGVDITKQYPSLIAALGRLPAHSMVLDGEICALDAGRRTAIPAAAAADQPAARRQRQGRR